jgi:hypothetical protein
MGRCATVKRRLYKLCSISVVHVASASTDLLIGYDIAPHTEEGKKVQIKLTRVGHFYRNPSASKLALFPSSGKNIETCYAGLICSSSQNWRYFYLMTETEPASETL